MVEELVFKDEAAAEHPTPRLRARHRAFRIALPVAGPLKLHRVYARPRHRDGHGAFGRSGPLPLSATPAMCHRR